MNRLIALLMMAAAATGLAPVPAAAHPHIFVTVSSEVVYGPNGQVTAVKHAWTFDDMFSANTVQGIESKQKDVYTREELAPIAEVNVTSLKEYNFFTQLVVGGQKVEFKDATDYWLEFKDSTLTLHFTLQPKEAVKGGSFALEVYDPDYFIDFGLAEKEPVRLASAPGNCKLEISKPGEVNVANGKRLSEAFFQKPDAANYGSQFASKITVVCK